MIRVAGYCRVSTDKEDQANSFEAQCRYFREYIARNPQWQLHEIYADEGITGTSTRKRIRFNQMMDDAHDGKFQLILTKEISRFSRNILDTIRFTRELKDLGIGVLFMTDGISSLDADAELRLSIMGSIAQEESRKTSARVKWGQTRQMERGVVFGGSLLGYDVKNGIMEVNEAEAVIVQRIFREYADGASTTAICKALEQEGILTRRGNAKWNPSYIIKILNNEKYVGDLVQKKTITTDYLTHRKKANRGEEEMIMIRDHHEPIISRSLWRQAQERLKKGNRRNGNAGGTNLYLFSGRIRCGICGRNYIARRRKRKDGTVYRFWACCGRQISDDLAMRMLFEVMSSISVDTIIDSTAQIAREARKVTGAPEVDLKEAVCRVVDRKTEPICRGLLEELVIFPNDTVHLRLRQSPQTWVFRLTK